MGNGQLINRRLSAMEKSQWLTDQQCCSNFLSHAHFIGPLNESILQQALEVLQTRHALLRVCIVREGRTNARFISDPAPAIPIRLAQSVSGKWTNDVNRHAIMTHL